MHDEIRDGKILEIAYQEAARTLEYQQKLHDSLITRSSTVGTISIFIATFFGKDALQAANLKGPTLLGFSVFEALALLCLFFAVGLAVGIILPKRGWIFFSSPKSIIDQFYRGGYTIEEAYDNMAGFLEDNRKKNDEKLIKLQSDLTIALILSLIQAMFWIIDLRVS